MRKTRFSHHRRRAIADVVSSAILLTTVTTVGVGAVAFTQANVNNHESDQSTHYNAIVNKVKESLGLERFWYDTANHNLNLVLKNTGDIGFTVIQIEIRGPINNITPVSNVQILPQGFSTIPVKYDWLGDPLNVFVTTTRGSIFNVQLVSPTDGVLIVNKVSRLSNGNFSYNGDLGLFNVTTAGYVPGANLDQNGNLLLNGVIRDFNGSAYQGGHPDFEKVCGSCPYGLQKGIVLPDLGADHEPVYNNNTNYAFDNGFVRFNQWYHDTPGVNIKEDYNLTLTKQNTVPTTWVYNNPNFFPIDGKLWNCCGKDGNGNPHNFSFTFEVHSVFTYLGGEKFIFSGDDDVWVFINHKIAMDLGGVHSNQTSSLFLDTNATQLGITKGGTYDFDFFYAERHTVASEMKITTSIKLQSNGVGRTSAFFVDPGKYTINEMTQPGWTLIDRQCDNGYTFPTSTAITVTVPKGVTTCTFTNTK